MCGALKRARLVHPGVAEVVFVKKDDAITAYKKYNNRCLDGRLGEGRHHAPLSVLKQWAFGVNYPPRLVQRHLGGLTS